MAQKILWCPLILLGLNELSGTIRKYKRGLERRLNGYTHWLLFQRIGVPFTAPTWQLSAICTKGSNELFWLPRAPGMHKVHMHVSKQNAQTQKVKTNGYILKKRKYKL